MAEDDVQIAHAYILVEVIPAKTHVIAAQIRDIRCAVVREVLGPYDIVVELEVDGRELVTSTLQEQIRSLDGVIHTVTCVVSSDRRPLVQHRSGWSFLCLVVR